MSSELTGKIAVVTGGATGIGRATVEHFVREGARVVIADVNRDEGTALADSLAAAAVFRETDVSDIDQVRALVEFAVQTFGGLDVLVNNAGISGPIHASFLDDDLEAFDKIFAINLRAVMVGTQAAAKYMAGNGGGSIINTSSIGGIMAGRGVITYRASKAAVIHFTKSAAIDLGVHGIRVNCLAPGSIPTTLLASSTTELEGEEREAMISSVRTTQSKKRPLNREGTVDDAAEAAVYLASDRARYVTGAVLRVDGGTAAGSTMTTPGQS
jgi:NAD(P)-dependent dehydrogenase (short-subunit alcohol dehydrogenase family)